MGQLEAMGDEISFIQRVRAEQFENVDFTFFASDQDSTRRSWKDARDAGSAIIDLSAVLEDEPGATVRSLWIERERGQVAPPELQPGPCVTAHPVAVTLALLLLRAKKAGGVRRAVATILDLKEISELFTNDIDIEARVALGKTSLIVAAALNHSKTNFNF